MSMSLSRFNVSCHVKTLSRSLGFHHKSITIGLNVLIRLFSFVGSSSRLSIKFLLAVSKFIKILNIVNTRSMLQTEITFNFFEYFVVLFTLYLIIWLTFFLGNFKPTYDTSIFVIMTYRKSFRNLILVLIVFVIQAFDLR